MAISQRAAAVLDGVLRRYVPPLREYALGTALVLGFKDDVDQQTKRAYADTGTTHIMAVSGLQVGLLFAALSVAAGAAAAGRVVGRRRCAHGRAGAGPHLELRLSRRALGVGAAGHGHVHVRYHRAGLGAAGQPSSTR
ncbi:MAG: ComEC/Rec2 family competence protein [Hymenobacter sp.]